MQIPFCLQYLYFSMILASLIVYPVSFAVFLASLSADDVGFLLIPVVFVMILNLWYADPNVVTTILAFLTAGTCVFVMILFVLQ